MKQGKCYKCHCRWVSDMDMGKLKEAKCPSCGSLLKQTAYFSEWPVRIDPKASNKYREYIRSQAQKGNKIYPGYKEYNL